MTERFSIHGQWSSRLIFILAATGSAVGLGNIWKFPYITGQNGGGAFVAVYLICILLVGIPIMIAEITLGRKGRQSPINTMRHLAESENASSIWALVGWIGMIAGFMILSYYSVVAGIVVAYVVRTASGVFNGATADGVKAILADLLQDPERLLAWHTLFMVMSMVVVARGVRSGLERATKLMMPALFVIVLVLVGYAYMEGDFQRGFDYLFTPNFDKVFFACDAQGQNCVFNGGPILVALGHSFFTLSLGMGAIMVYGSYMPRSTSIMGSAIIIAILDTLVALLAGLAIFPIVFANGLEPAAGFGLIFQSLPLAFGAMKGGQFFGSLFFLLVVFAAWSSAISLIEPAVAWLVENQGMTRPRAAIATGILAWFLGLGTVFSFNIWSGAEFQFFGKTFFDLMDYVTSNIMLPLGGLAIALFAGWCMTGESAAAELRTNRFAFSLWRLVIRYLSPVLVLFIFLQAIGAL